MKNTWFSNYAERPSRLFNGAEVLLTIILARASSDSAYRLYSTGFTKWSAEERPVLFERVFYSGVEKKPKPYIIPKLMDEVEPELFDKMFISGRTLGENFHRNQGQPVFYRIGGGRYWKIFTNFQPKFVLNGNPSVSSRENYLYLTSPQIRDLAISILSSSVFYWYFILTTNCRDLNPSDLNEYPVSLNTFRANNLNELEWLCEKLMNDYQNKSELKEKRSKLTGDIVYQEFYPRLSKSILDEIDYVLARHYGFTEEELDFIINYDIKYRMGREAEKEEDEK